MPWPGHDESGELPRLQHDASAGGSGLVHGDPTDREPRTARGYDNTPNLAADILSITDAEINCKRT